jgi:hypothetical protein
MKRLQLFCLVATVGLTACTKARTEAYVVITTEGLTVPTDIDGVKVIISDFTAQQQLYSLPLALCHDTLDSNCYHFPLTMTLIPGTTHPSDQVRVEVTGQRGGADLLSDAALFTFSEGQSLRLDFVLYANCIGNLSCAQLNQACGAMAQCTTIKANPFVGEPDLAAPADLAGAPDLASPGDLAGADLQTAPGSDLAQSSPDMKQVQPPSDMAQGPPDMTCIPSCTNRQCGLDTCGINSCGVCGGSEMCSNYQCVPNPPDLGGGGPPDGGGPPCGSMPGAPCCAVPPSPMACMLGLTCTSGFCH